MSGHGRLVDTDDTRPLTDGLELLSRHKIFKFKLQAVNEYSDVFLIFFLIFRIFIFYSIGNVEQSWARAVSSGMPGWWCMLHLLYVVTPAITMLER